MAQLRPASSELPNLITTFGAMPLTWLLAWKAPERPDAFKSVSSDRNTNSRHCNLNQKIVVTVKKEQNNETIFQFL